MLKYWSRLYECLKSGEVINNGESDPILKTFISHWMSLENPLSEYSLSYEDYPEQFNSKILITSLNDSIGYETVRPDLAHTYFPGARIYGIGTYDKLNVDKNYIDSMSSVDEFINFCFKSLKTNLNTKCITDKFIIKNRRSKKYLDHWGLVSVNLLKEYAKPQDTIDAIYNQSLDTVNIYSFRLFPWNIFFLLYTPLQDMYSYLKMIDKTYRDDTLLQLARCC